jgi:hypothetical protein
MSDKSCLPPVAALDCIGAAKMPPWIWRCARLWFFKPSQQDAALGEHIFAAQECLLQIFFQKASVLLHF